MDEKMTADNLNELWDVYDQNEHKIGQCQRGDQLAPGTYHLVVNAFLFNHQGEVLLQQRSFQKLSGPGVWECSVGGSVLAGEQPQAAMVREIREELGLDVASTQLKQLSHHIHESWIDYWFVAQVDFALTDVTIQMAEVEQVALLSFPEACQRIGGAGDGEYLAQLKKALELK